MATHDVDQKILGRLANATANSHPVMSSALYRILGLSILLSRRLLRARTLRKLDTTRETKSLALYHHIIWLSREGLALLEIYVLPDSERGQYGSELQILGAKLRASFYHVFCLFRNTPPLTSLSDTSIPLVAPTGTSDGIAVTAGGPLSPIHTNGHAKHNLPNAIPKAPSPPTVNPKLSPKEQRQAALRDAIPSMTSEASYITNPFASGGGGGGNVGLNIPTGSHQGTANTIPGLTPPPGLPNLPQGRNSPLSPTPSTTTSATFLLPALNFLPSTTRYFSHASTLATQLPGSAPLRLSVALEHAAFLWDCARDRAGARRLAKRAIADVYRAQEGMEDAEFEDAAGLVGALGAIMKRAGPSGAGSGSVSASVSASARSPRETRQLDPDPDSRRPPAAAADVRAVPKLRGGGYRGAAPAPAPTPVSKSATASKSVARESEGARRGERRKRSAESLSERERGRGGGEKRRSGGGEVRRRRSPSRSRSRSRSRSHSGAGSSEGRRRRWESERSGGASQRRDHGGRGEKRHGGGGGGGGSGSIVSRRGSGSSSGSGRSGSGHHRSKTSENKTSRDRRPGSARDARERELRERPVMSGGRRRA